MCNCTGKSEDVVTAQDVMDMFRLDRPFFPKREAPANLRLEALNLAVMASDFGTSPAEIMETTLLFYTWLTTDMKE
jgi:hypothetical protein